MKIKLYGILALVAIISAVIALIRIALGQDSQEVVSPNITIGVICVIGMYVLLLKERKQIKKRKMSN